MSSFAALIAWFAFEPVLTMKHVANTQPNTADGDGGTIMVGTATAEPASSAGPALWIAQARPLRSRHDHRNDPFVGVRSGARTFNPNRPGFRLRACGRGRRVHGKLAEVFITADDAASGEATIFVDGEAIVSSSFDETRGVTTWTSSEPGAHEAAAAAMLAISEHGRVVLLDAFIPDAPQEFPCSEYGKKVLKVTKRIWGGMMVAAGAACCISSGAVGCILCSVVADQVKDASDEALENYCD